jgi:AcrR family transcriptional regulator
VTEQDDGREDGRRPIMRAAWHEFARRPFSVVSLDDIAARAGLTKGAMYARFESKRALALAIIDDQLGVARTDFTDRPGNKLSGLESLIEGSYFLATQDMTNDGVRAALNLLGQVGRRGGVQARVLTQWSPAITAMVQGGIKDGDVIDDVDPEPLSRLVMSIYMGLRQTAGLDDAQRFFTELEYAWTAILPGFARADRLGYFARFVTRCATVAKNNMPSRTSASS